MPIIISLQVRSWNWLHRKSFDEYIGYWSSKRTYYKDMRHFQFSLVKCRSISDSVLKGHTKCVFYHVWLGYELDLLSQYSFTGASHFILRSSKIIFIQNNLHIPWAMLWTQPMRSILRLDFASTPPCYWISTNTISRSEPYIYDWSYVSVNFHRQIFFSPPFIFYC